MIRSRNFRCRRWPTVVSMPNSFHRRLHLPIGRIAGAFAVIAVSSVAVACSNVLPRTELITESPWDSFGEAKAAFDAIKPGKTTSTALGGCSGIIHEMTKMMAADSPTTSRPIVQLSKTFPGRDFTHAENRCRIALLSGSATVFFL